MSIAWAIWSAPRSPGALYLRAVEERNHHSIVLREGQEPSAQTLGFKLASEEDLDRAADWFKRRNLPTAFPEVPYQGRTLRTADSTGMPLEFYFKMDQGERMLQRYAAYQGARIQRIDHINCFTPDVQASYDFYTELGFRLTEYTETDDTAIPSSGRCGCTARAMSTTSPSPTAAARACITSASGPRARSTSCTSAT